MDSNQDWSECLIFLGHSGHREHIAEPLYNEIVKRMRYPAPGTIFFESSLTSEIPSDAIDACRIAVLLISPKFLRSERPMRELQLLVERSQDTSMLTMYPIFYDINAIDEHLESESAVLEKWGSIWSKFGEDVDIETWAQYVVETRKKSADILNPNNVGETKLYMAATRIVMKLPMDLQPKMGAPIRVALLEIGSNPAGCRYTTSTSLVRANKHVSFYLQPDGYDEPQENQCPKAGLFGQRPESGAPNESTTVEMLLFENGDQVQANTLPIGSGNEWWELIWTDRGSVVYTDDHSCWRLRPEKIPQGFVCLSPCFFKIEPLQKTRNRLLGLKEEYKPPSDDDVRGMVLVREDLVNFVSAEQLLNVWDDSGSGATQSLAIYTGPGSCGCFAFTTYDPPTGDNYPILDRTKFR